MTSHVVTSRTGKIEDIEALRAIAVLLTIVEHLKYFLPWHGNPIHRLDDYFAFWSGVDLFFAISGFVIARDILGRLDEVRDADRCWKTIISFWIRRVYRIWPTSLLWALVIVAGAIASHGNIIWGSVRQSLADFTAILAQVANFHFWACQSKAGSCGNANVWWSLALEEQFYLALPLIILFFRRWLVQILFAIVVVQIFIPRPLWSLMWATRTDAIALGVLLALFARRPLHAGLRPSFLRKPRYAALVTGALFFLLISLPSNWLGKLETVPFSTGLTAIVSLILVFIASFDQNYIARGWLIKPVLMWIGARSFGLYLIHTVSIMLTCTIWILIEPHGTHFGPEFAGRYLVTWLVLTIGLCEINYRFLETPLREKGKQVARLFMERRIESAPYTSPVAAPGVLNVE